VRKKILIIDDEVDLVELLKIRLEVDNYYVMPLYTSTRALEVAKREKPDLILLDVMMPGKNGYEVCGELKADSGTRSIPVLMFTAKEEQKYRIKEEALSIGAEGYIIKPFDATELVIKIKSLIG
jgi:two-component system alkaline phosphatase synthesis response regulator PhoP